MTGLNLDVEEFVCSYQKMREELYHLRQRRNEALEKGEEYRQRITELNSTLDKILQLVSVIQFDNRDLEYVQLIVRKALVKLTEEEKEKREGMNPVIEVPEDIVEQIMSQHWDMKTCECWVCKHGYALGLYPQDKHMRYKMEKPLEDVQVAWDTDAKKDS